MALMDEAREHAEQACRDLEADEDFLPFLAFRRWNGETGIIGMPLCGCDEHMPLFADAMTATLAAYRAVEAVLGLVAWTLECSREEHDAWGDRTLADHPARVERVALLRIGLEGSDLAAVAQVRRERGLVILGEWHAEGPESITGLLSASLRAGLILGAGMPEEMAADVERHIQAGEAATVVQSAIRAIRMARELGASTN